MNAAQAPAPTPETGGQRSRILATALRLMGEHGAPMTSMRQLATACGLNVATLYHYFPSKDAILRALIADKRYVERLNEDVPPVDTSLAPRDRIEQLLSVMFAGVLAEEATLRLVIGESLRGEQVALDAVADLSDALETTLRQWLETSFPELTAEAAVVARLLRDQLLSFCVEALATRDPRRIERARQRTSDVVALLFPSSS